MTLCPECHHRPSIRYGDPAWCYCKCHDVADAAPELLEALEMLVRLMPELTIRDIIHAGEDVIEASGINPWCISEGLATGDEMHDVTWKARAAIARARGEAPETAKEIP